MDLQTMLEVMKWIIFTIIITGNLSMLIGIIQPLLSPTGRSSHIWFELGWDAIKIGLFTTALWAACKTLAESAGVI